MKNRIEWLDVVRGIALCGIAFANIGTLWKIAAPRSFSYDLMQLLVQQRFFPVFSFLFGLGFGLMWAKGYGRIPLLRRFLFIGALGALHQLIHPGEALLFYAAAALFILLPSTYMPRAWTLVLAS
nr:heparan-alpha-glucosaminide N-acetyltransferase domain-containing protein [Corynebacterium pseudotuberculosis]